jgi:imidazolonepropionase-like amidohydrolase
MRALKPWALVVAATLTLVALVSIRSASVLAQSGVVAYEGARVIVGDGSAAIENATFVVTNGHFTQVGRTGQVKVPAGAMKVNLAGKTVMPSIVESHTHLNQMRPALINDLERRAYYGIGAAISLGQDVGEAPYEIRNELLPNAARFRTAGRGITMPEPGRTTAPMWVTNEAEARKAVDDNAAKHVTIIKIWVDDRNGTVKQLTPDLYRVIIDEAHKNKLRVNAHSLKLDDTKDLLRAGVDALAHSVSDKELDDEAVQLYRGRKGLVVVPTLGARGVPADMSWLSDSMSPDDLKKLQAANSTARPDAQKTFAIQAANLMKLSKAGVKLAVGTDGNSPYAPHQEMEDMVAAGLTPGQVITAATKNGAEFLQISDMGTIAKGKSADFIVLDANPLEDITNTRKISDVYLRGTQVDRAGLRAKWMGQQSSR